MMGNRTMVIVVHFLLVSMLLSCGQKGQQINLSDIEKAPFVLLSEHEIVASGFINPSDIISYDTLIFISDRYSTNMIQVYSEDGQYIRGILKAGRGPGESTNLLKLFNAIVGLLDIRCTQDYFYLLYSGKEFGHATFN